MNSMLDSNGGQNKKRRGDFLMKKTANGITIVSLVVTIILLLILSTVSIQALTNTGLFESTSKAKLENKRGQITEWLSLKLYETQSENYNKTEEEIIELTRQNVENNKSELEKIGKSVTIDREISTEEDGEKVEPYFYVVVDKDIYKVSMEEQKFIGEDGKLLPIIKLVSISNTSNSITVKVKTSRNEGGKLKYYIKEYDTSDYTLVKELEDETYTYEDLKQGVKYSVKIVAENANKLTSEVVEEQITGTVIDLKEGDLEFTSEPSTWTNTDVNVTVKANIDTKGYTLQTSKDGTNWDSTTTQTYSSNGRIYARLWDGTNYGSSVSTNFTNIDKTVPTVSTALSSTSTSINSVSLSVGIIDENSGLGKVEWYYGTTNNPTTLAGTTPVTTMNGSVAGPTTAQTKTYTVTGLSAGTTYYFKAIVYDVAGNQVSSSIINAKTNVVSKDIGDEVTVGGEQFYVLNWNSNSETVDLITKYNLNTAGTAQQSAKYSITACEFSSTNYWSSITSFPFDLNDCTGYRATDAIGKAKSYGRSKGAVSSRLLSSEEAKELNAQKDSNTKIDAMYRGTANTTDGYLNYWIGEAYAVNGVSGVMGSGGSLLATYYGSSSIGFGVRPVITVLKSNIS